MTRDVRRAQLLDAAVALLEAEGPGAVTMERLADRAGVSKPVVYDHFANRTELVLGVLARTWAEIDAGLAARAATPATPAARLRATFEALLDTAARQGPNVRALVDSVSADPEVERARRRAEGEGGDWAAGLERDLALAPAIAAAAAATLRAAMVGAVARAKVPSSRRPRRRSSSASISSTGRAGRRRYFHGFGRIGRDLLWLHPHQAGLRPARARTRRRGAFRPLRAQLRRGARTNSPIPTRAIPLRRWPRSTMPIISTRRCSRASCAARAKRAGSSGSRGGSSTSCSTARAASSTHVALADGRTVDGDLFVDCSGMRALLIGDALGVGYEDWNHWLLMRPRAGGAVRACRAAHALHPRRPRAMHGWQWRIPLQHRTGNGHVYSSEP